VLLVPEGEPMSPGRLSTDKIVSEYLAGGGHITKIPDAILATTDEVFEYLRSGNVEIEEARSKNANSVRKFHHDGQLIDTESLLQLANQHRGQQDLAPFAFK
jgi:hypothetical protein